MPGIRGSRKKAAFWSAAGAAVLALLLYWLFAPLSPSAIMRRSVHALETGDSPTLYSLASPDEVKRLHLSPQNIESMLAATLWRNGHPSDATITPGDLVADQDVWYVKWADGRRASIFVLEDPDGHWYLLVTLTLYSIVDREVYRTVDDPTRRYYDALARKYGIDGVRWQDGTYSAPLDGHGGGPAGGPVSAGG
ncbi:MAG TPA: hypothetical protein VFJ58_07480 [Armatimonadota bacterium]|nr:hypothetical protein [Armatimonadota bacterium]